MTHRFYIADTKDRSGELELTQDLWVNDAKLVNQVLRVLRMRIGEQIVFFDGRGKELLYKIDEIEPLAFHVHKVTDVVPKEPERKVILAWGLLKKDKNDWVLQKCTELGVTHFLPIITDRTEKTGFNVERAQKIIIEAVEQCSRHSIPLINEPQRIEQVIGQYQDHMSICVADMEGQTFQDDGKGEVLVLVGPEGGWSDKERALFADKKVPHISVSNFTLRAETACIASVQSLV